MEGAWIVNAYQPAIQRPTTKLPQKMAVVHDRDHLRTTTATPKQLKIGLHNNVSEIIFPRYYELLPFFIATRVFVPGIAVSVVEIKPFLQTIEKKV